MSYSLNSLNEGYIHIYDIVRDYIGDRCRVVKGYTSSFDCIAHKKNFYEASGTKP